MAKTTPPPVIGVLVFLAVFFGFVFGTMITYEGDQALGIAVYIIAAVVSASLYIGWRMAIRA